MSYTIKIENLSVSLSGKTILEDVNVTIESGKLTAIIGPNGAGKTTLLKCIMGTIPYRGKIKILTPAGTEVNDPKIGYVPQHLAIEPGTPLSVCEFLSLGTGKPILLGTGRKRRKQLESLLYRVRGEHLIDKTLAELSGGELQRVLLARSLSDKPEVLLLDEPASGIDIAGEELFCELLEDIQKATGKTIVLVSHDLSVVTRHADSVICLDKTIKCSGLPVEIMSRENLLSLFGPHSSLYLHGDEHDSVCRHGGKNGKEGSES